MSDDPPFLSLGTEVSAKFKGAFCEARVRKVEKSFKCRVNLGPGNGSVNIADEFIRGDIELYGDVEVELGRDVIPGTITSIKDHSQYTVEFNDGDVKELRRTQLVLKSGRHFEPAVSLNSMPLYNPDHFSNPVVQGNKKRARQSSAEPSPQKKRSKDDDEEEEGENEGASSKRTMRAASVAAGPERRQSMARDQTPALSRRKAEKEEQRRKEQERRLKERREKEEEWKRKQEEWKRKEKEEEEKEEERKRLEKERKRRAEEEEEKKITKANREQESPAIPAGHEMLQLVPPGEKKEPLKPGTAVVVVIQRPEGDVVRYPALTICPEAYKTHAPNGATKPPAPTQTVVRSFINDSYVRVKTEGCKLFATYDMSEFRNNKETDKMRLSIGKATMWNLTRTLPEGWTLEGVFGPESRKQFIQDMVVWRKEQAEERRIWEEERQKGQERMRIEDEKLTLKVKKELARREEEKIEAKKKREEERKKREEEMKRKLREEREKKKEEKEKKQQEAVDEEEDEGSSASDSEEEDEASNQERDVFIAQLYKFHEERNTPINKAPVWGGKDLDLHKLYRLVTRYGGPKKCSDASKWKRIQAKLQLEGTGAQPGNVKKAYMRYLNEFHSTYSQLGWSLDDLATKIVSGGRSAKKAVNYGFTKRRYERKDQSKQADKDSSFGSGTGERDSEGFRPPSSAEAHSRRSLSNTTGHSGSPMPSSSSTAATPAARKPAKKGKRSSGGTSAAASSRAASESTELSPATAAKPSTSTTAMPSMMTPLKTSTSTTTMTAMVTPVKPVVATATAAAASATARASSSFTTPSASPARYLTPAKGAPLWAHDNAECAEDEHVPANILTHFYKGMNLLSLHNGKWYTARVVEVQAPPFPVCAEAIQRALGGVEKPEPGQSYELGPLDTLREMSKKIRCFVHYLGWNARYDEWARLPEMRITQQDEVQSVRLARPRLGKAVVAWMGAWSRTRVGMSQLCGPFEGDEEPVDQSSAFSLMAVSQSWGSGARVKVEVVDDGYENEEKEKEKKDDRTPATPAAVEKASTLKTPVKAEEVDEEEYEHASTSAAAVVVAAPPPPPAPSASPVPPPPPPSMIAATAIPAAAAAAAACASAAAERSSITDTIEQVCAQLARAKQARADREAKEREDREKVDEAMRRDKEAALLAAKQTKDKCAVGVMIVEDEEEDEFFDFSAAVRSREEAEAEERERARKEVRSDKKERKSGGMDRVEEADVKKKDAENEKEKAGMSAETERDEEKMEVQEGEEEASALFVPPPEPQDEPMEGSKEEEEGREEEGKENEAREEIAAAASPHFYSPAPRVATTIDTREPPAKKKRKKSSKREQGADESEEEEPVIRDRPPHVTLSVLQTRMLQATQTAAAGARPLLGHLPHITQTNLYGERTMLGLPQFMQHKDLLAAYWQGVQANLARMNARQAPVRDQQRQHAAASAPAAATGATHG